MEIDSLKHLLRLVSVPALAAIVSACSGTGAVPNAPTQATAAGQVTAAGRLSPAVKTSYFYTSAQNVGVTLYSYPQLSQLGSVSDPNAAAMCSDKDGNVYVAESGTSELTEYQAGTLTVMRTIADTNYTPVSCAINPKNGDLAVANSGGTVNGKSKPGSITIFKKATGSPKVFTNKSMSTFAYCGYDTNGDLFADGLATDSSVALTELVGQKLTSLPVSGFTIAQPGAVAWDTFHGALLISDNSGVLYRFYIDNGTAQFSDTYTALHGALSLNSNVAFKGKFVAGATSSAIAVWQFPSGDGPKYFLDTANVIGVAFSTPK
jgi:hypothetical protein